MNQPIVHLVFFRVCILLFILVAVPALSDARRHPDRLTDADSEILRGIHLLYDWEFDRAERLFSHGCASHPGDPAPFFYHAMVSWSRLASGFWNPETVNEYGRRIDRTISVARARIKGEDADSHTYLYLGGALGFKGRFALMERKWIASFNMAYQAVKALKTCQRMDPENRDVLLGLGIYDYYTARLSGVTKFVSQVLIRKGNKKEGLRKLHVAADEALYSGIEAKSMLVHIYLFLESGYREAKPLAEELSVRFPNNPRYHFLQGIIYIRLGMRRDYKNILEGLFRRSKTDPSRSKAGIWKNRALYLQASDCLFRGQYDMARSLLFNIREYADPIADPSMAAWPLIKIGMSYDLEGQRHKALSYYNRVMKMENGAGAQFLAEKFINKAPEKGNPFIGY